MNNEKSNHGKDNLKSDILFKDWISKYFKNFSILVAVVAVFNVVLPFLYNSKILQKLMLPILYGTQALFITVIFGIIFFDKEPKTYKKYPRGSNAVMQFWKWWPWLWFAWAMLYVLLTFVSIFESEFFKETVLQKFLTNSKDGIQIILHIINNIATIILTMFFYFLALPSVTEKDSEKKGSKISILFMFGILILIILALTEIALLSIAKNGDQIIKIFGIFYGIFAATATALVIGRLDSQILGVPKGAIIILFIYAAIQPTFYFLIGDTPVNYYDPEYIFKALIITFALISKILFFDVIHWLAMSGRFVFFMDESKKMYDRIDYDRESFLKTADKTEDAH